MPNLNRLPLIGLIGALALAGCNQPGEDAANNAAADNMLVDGNTIADDGAVIESEETADDDAVDVVDLPPPPASAPAADTAPLTEAETIEEEIDRGTGIERVRYGNGWAWTRGGRILRTADREGRNVEYFRPGEDRPFFVQRGERSWAYDQGRATREYDRDGRATVPDDRRRRDAEEAERGARERRGEAERARDRGPRRDEARPSRPTPSATPIATPSPSATPSLTPTASPSPRGRGDGADPRPRPTSTAREGRPGRDEGRRAEDRRGGERQAGQRDGERRGE